MVLKLKQWYLRFLEKDKRNIFEGVLYCTLYFFSGIYAIVVALRNFLYAKKITPSYSSSSKIISIGNLCWSGSGKTSLSIWLYKKFFPNFKVAILRRGYGDDEGKMLREVTENVFSSPDRRKLVKKLEALFDIFILDDGFQYRKLSRDINIVVMGAREFRKKYRLIPAYFFREPIFSLRRADIIVLNYVEELQDSHKIKQHILNIAPDAKVYFAKYKISGFSDINGNSLNSDLLKGKRISAFTAIGYPQGFFNKLNELNLSVERKIVYPDHYELSEVEFDDLQNTLINSDINYLVITQKDKFHFPHKRVKINIIIMKIEIEIDNEVDLMRDLSSGIGIEIKN